MTQIQIKQQLKSNHLKNEKQLQAIKERFQNDESVNARVENLKSQLKLVNDNYYEQAYYILSQIIILRRTQIKNYGQTNLASEKNIGLSRHQIYTIMCYKYISKENLHKIGSGKLRTASVMYIIRSDKKFQEPKYQNKAIERMEKGEFNIRETHRIKEYIFNEKLNYKEESHKADRQLSGIMSDIQRAYYLIEQKENLFTDKKLVQSVINTAERLIKKLNAVLNFGKRLK